MQLKKCSIAAVDPELSIRSFVQTNMGFNQPKSSAEHEEMVVEKISNDDTASDLKVEPELLDSTTKAYKAAEKRLTRKLDLTLLPCLWILYLCNYLGEFCKAP